MQGVGGREIHRATEKFAERPPEADKGKEANPDRGVIVDEEVNITSLAGLAPHCRAEHADFLHSVLLEHLAVGLQGATYVCGVHNRILPKTHADVKTHYHSPASAARVASLHTIGPSLDTDGRRAVAEYILRSPFSLENLRYQASTGANIYQSRMHQVLKRNFAVFSACDWLAALTARIRTRASTSCGTTLVQQRESREAAEDAGKGRGVLHQRGVE